MRVVTSPYLRLKRKTNHRYIFTNYLTDKIDIVTPGQYKLLKHLRTQTHVDTSAWPYLKEIEGKRLLDASRLWQYHSLRRAEIEVNSYCNWQCAYCPSATVKRSRRVMDMEHFHIILKKCMEYGSISTICLHVYSEPTIDSFFNERITEIARFGFHLELFTKTDRKTFICSDPMIMGEHLCEMSYDDFFKGCYRSHRIGRHVIPAIQENEMISLTRNHLAKLDLENSFSKLYHVLSHTQTLIDEYQDDAGHVWSSLLDMNLGYYLTGTHQLYAEYLVFLSTLNNKYRMFIEYANTSITLSKKWNTVRNIIYKSYLKDNYQECLSMLLKEVEQIRDISIALKTNVIRCITSIQV